MERKGGGSDDLWEGQRGMYGGGGVEM